ncbi:hypothetical protein L3X38_011802 [Prunus dulcis]|uniref:Retroviral polymerase SH3-like domain-containing protein n=1 Tax=Prunus dulcis TaxID=3755 RepID=A0AAD4ZFS0_PRUDU|nr:hypothetical protein L3X38_011802 [Prunus dulcis]
MIVTPRTGSAVAGYCPLWAWLHSHQPARFCFWELTKQLPRVVTHPGMLLRELPETKPCGLWEAFWELTGFGFVGTPKFSELEAGAIPGWVTTLGSCFVSSQKQNRAGCAYAVIPTDEASKLKPKPLECILLDFQRGVKGYNIWDPVNMKKKLCRDVLFDEKTMPMNTIKKS